MIEKLPNELSLEDLLNSLGEATPQQLEQNSELSLSGLGPVLSFIQAFNILPGNELVTDIDLYRLFRLWAKDSLITRRNFNVQAGRHIISQLVGGKRYYSINHDLIKISQETLTILKDHQIDKTKSKYYKNHFEKFLNYYCLEAGTVFVEVDLLYYLYDKGNTERRVNNLLGYESFVQMCGLFFKQKRLSRHRLAWFGVSRNIKNHLNEETVLNWRQGRLKHGRYKRTQDASAEGYKPYPKYRKKSLYPDKTAENTKPRSKSKNESKT